jgi:protein SCO1/2
MQSIGYRYSYDAASREYAHPAGIVVLTPAGRVARYFVGIDIAPRDLRLSLVQASAGKIGTPIDKLLLFCYRYDPASSKLGARVMGALQIGGALAVLGLAALLLSLWYRDSAQGRKSRDSDRTPAALESGRFSDIDEEALADEDFIDDEEEEQWRRLHRRPQERTS